MKHLSIISDFRTDLRKGLGSLFQTYGQTLYGYGRDHWSLNDDEAYDVLYKTLETVGKVISRYEFVSERHFTNWLFKIHKNNLLQFLRSKRAKELNTTRMSLADWMSEAKEAEEDVNEGELQKAMEKISISEPLEEKTSASPLMLALGNALQQLPEFDRDLLLLRMNNYSYDDIARMLNVENNQLKVRFSRAKAKLRKKTLELLGELNK